MKLDFDTLNIILLALMMASAVWAVVTSRLLWAAVGLALTSAVLTLVLFILKAPIAAVFELSVCAGLITVVFISVISLTQPVNDTEAREIKMKRIKRFIFLPIFLVLAGWILSVKSLHLGAHETLSAETATVQQVLWFTRRFDLIGQILVILAGVFGVIVLFKTKQSTDGDTKQ